jgi:hypothetical protein
MGRLLVPILPVVNVLEGGFGMRKSDGPYDSAVRDDPAAPETRRTTHEEQLGRGRIAPRWATIT